MIRYRRITPPSLPCSTPGCAGHRRARARFCKPCWFSLSIGIRHAIAEARRGDDHAYLKALSSGAARLLGRLRSGASEHGAAS